LFAVVCIGAGTLLHQWADGCSPGPTGPALAVPAVWLAAFGLARRERSPRFVTGALGVAQLCLHLELGLFCPPGGATTMPGTPGMPGMPGMPSISGMPGAAAGISPATCATGHGTAAMVLGHVVAVLICGWWLGRGERCFFELCRAVAFVAAPAVDLLRGRHVPAGAAPAPPVRRGIHVTAPYTSSPPQGPAPGPRLLRGPPPASRPTFRRPLTVTT
jgi:hypothetical protein